MNSKKIENVVSLSVEDRYNYFIRKVAEFEEVWGLYHENGWALLSDSDNGIIIPFWPEQEFALLCCSEQWKDYTPKLITLDDFMNKWLPGMKNDNRLANVFYIPNSKTGTIIGPEVLLKELNEEIQSYL